MALGVTLADDVDTVGGDASLVVAIRATIKEDVDAASGCGDA